MTINVQNTGYFWGRREERERVGGEPQPHDLGLKKGGEQVWKTVKIWLTQWLVPDVQYDVLFYYILYDGNILQYKLNKININKIMSCKSVFTGLCATSLQCPAGKTLPLLRSLPPASQVTACFPLQDSPWGWGWNAIFSALQPLSVPLYLPAPLRDTNYLMVLSLNLAHHYRWLQNIGYHNSLH